LEYLKGCEIEPHAPALEVVERIERQFGAAIAGWDAGDWPFPSSSDEK